MNKNLIIVLMIFLVPLGLYWGLTKDKKVAVLPTIAVSGPEIIKFSSQMCYECQELEKVFDEVYPGVANKISLRKIDVTKKDKRGKDIIVKEDAPLGNANFLSQLQSGEAVLYSTYQNKEVGAALAVNVDGDGKSYIVIDYKNLIILNKQEQETLDAL